MSLNYTVDKIADYKNVCNVGDGDARRMNPVTEGLIWSSMSVGLDSIKKKNVDEWLVRLALTDALFGTMLKANREDRPFTRAEIESHIGLTTNVSNMTRKKWQDAAVSRFMRDTECRFMRDTECAEAITGARESDI